jgi:hypothetical protein
MMSKENIETGSAIELSFGDAVYNTSSDMSAQNTQAGYTSLMAEGNPTGETYYEVHNENETLGYSPTSQYVNDMLHNEETTRMLELLPDVLLDENVSEEFKEEAVSRVFDQERKETDISLKYARDLVESTESDETTEYSEVKESLFTSLSNINEYRQAQQAIMDSSNLVKDQNAVAEATDFISLMVPFYEQIKQVDVANKALGGDAGSIVKSFLLLGNSKDDLRKHLEKLPLEERIVVLEKLTSVLDEANTTLGMTNRVSGRQELKHLVYGGNYEDWERWLDNAVGILDLTIVGKPIAWLTKALKGTKEVKSLTRATEEFQEAVKVDAVRSEARPTAPNRMAQETNAETTREQIADIIGDVSGESSQALSGTNRAEAVADVTMPEIEVSGKGLRNKVGRPLADVEKAEISNPLLREMVDDTSIGALTKKEIEAANAKVVNKLHSVKGITPRDEMFQIRQTEEGAIIRGVYGPSEGGFVNASEARDLVEVAMREKGITADQLTILKRGTNGEYVEVDGIPTDAGDYLIGYDYKYKTRFSDINANWDKLEVSRNFLDRVPLLAEKSVSRHFLDTASMLDPHLTLGAYAAVDKSARVTKLMLKDAKEFSDGLLKLTGDSQDRIIQYIKEANEKGLSFDRASLKADRGFTEAEVKSIEKFRSFWDDEWALHNKLEAKRMRNDGYFVLEDAASDTRIFGKPRGKANLDRNRSVLDPETEDLRKLSDEELEKLYKEGGGIIEMRKPIEFDGILTDYVIFKGSDAVRAVKETDIVFPYRHGYYRVNYTAPHFIIKEVKDGDRVLRTAIATADSVKDANLYLARLSLHESEAIRAGKIKYSIRGNVKDSAERAGFERDVFETYGDSSQRFRGKQLENASAVVHDTVQTNIKNPVETMIDASRTMGSRVAFSDYMQAMKKRFMATYEDLLPKEHGITRFPSKMEDIGGNAKSLSKEVADARTTFEYISYLEHGYLNAVDEVWKGGLRAAAEALGIYSTTGESLLRGLGKLSPTQLLKTAAFQVYIALNPIRQFLLNAHQSMLLLANFPKYVVSPRGVIADMAVFTDLALGGKNLKNLSKMTKRSEAELKTMWKEFQKSGLADSIDFNNMVRGSLQQFAETAKIKGSLAGKIVSAPSEISRKVGFDAGEWISLATAWLAHYDRAAESGKALTKTDFFNIGAEARNYTLGMNRAGDMPYNQNTFALVFQFFQVPHKALLQMSNKVLTVPQRLRLFAFSAFAYSLPPAAMYSLFGGVLPDREEHPELHDAIVQGLEFYLFNRALRTISDSDTNINFSSLSPADAYGVYELIHSLLTTEAGQIIAKSPAGSLFFGDNPRLTNFAKSVGKFVNPMEEDKATSGELLKEMLNISSGYSNYFRSKMAYEHHKMFNTQGVVTDASVTSDEARAKLLGFETMDEALARYMKNKSYSNKEEAEKDVDNWWKEHSARLFREGISSEDAEYELRLMSQAMIVFKDQPWAMEHFMKVLEKQISKGDGRFYNIMLKASELMTPAEMEEFFNNVPEFDKEKAKALKDTIKNIREWDYNNG